MDAVSLKPRTHPLLVATHIRAQDCLPAFAGCGGPRRI